MGLKSKAKSNIGLFNFETTSELSIMKKWENNGIVCKTSFYSIFLTQILFTPAKSVQ